MKRRYLMQWYFEDGSYVEVIINGDVATEEVLTMIQTFVDLKKKEIAGAR